MSSDSDTLPSSVLGEQQDLLECGGCGQCFECKIDDANYFSGREYSAPPYTCFTCNEHFEDEYFGYLHELDHSMENIFECTICNENYATIEDLTKHKETQHTVAVSEDTGNIEQEAVYVKEPSLPKEQSTSRGNLDYQSPSGESNKRKISSWFREPSSPTGENVYETRQSSTSNVGQDDPIPSREADNRRLRELLELSPRKNLDLLRTDQTSTSRGSHKYQRPSGEINKRQLPPSSIEEERYETRQLSTSNVDQDDPHLSLEAHNSRLRDLLELSTASNLGIPRTEQPSTSSCKRGYQLPTCVSSSTQYSSVVTSLLNYRSEKAYRTGQSSTSRYDYNYHRSPSERKDQICEPRSLECKDGGEKSLSPSSSNFHRHTGESEKEFKCETCGKSYKNKCSLKVHEKNHTRETKPTCDKCGKTYSTDAALKEHQRYACDSHKLKCRFCGKTLTRKCILRDHEFRCKKRKR